MRYHRGASCGLTSYSAADYSDASDCPACSARLDEGTKLVLRPGRARHVTRSLTVGVEAPAEARRAVIGLPLPQDAHDRLALVISELVTNAVVHAGLVSDAAVQLRVTLQRGGSVRVEVRDCGRGFHPAPRAHSDPPTPGGRGLMIVAELSDAWGVELRADGCMVWCEIPVEEAAALTEQAIVGAYVRELSLEMATAQAGRTP